MRGRLGMYLGTTSITKLAAFLRGYDYALEQSGGAGRDPLLEEFRDWIHRHFQTTRQSWEETILLHSADEADAVRRFWVLLDEFLAERPGGPMSPEDETGAGPGATDGAPNPASGSPAGR
jgi:hypothetical protein